MMKILQASYKTPALVRLKDGRMAEFYGEISETGHLRVESVESPDLDFVSTSDVAEIVPSSTVKNDTKRTFEVYWHKNYEEIGAVTIRANNEEEAREIALDNMGDYTGSMQYLDGDVTKVKEEK